MMDRRSPMPAGTVLRFPGLTCHIEGEIGRGSNAIVYRGWYEDHHHAGGRHEVLIKELFPLHPNGEIYREADGSIFCTQRGQQTYAIHRRSFESGNEVHLTMLRQHPDAIGANLNTYALNNTLYTLLGFSGGRSMSEEVSAPAATLRPLTERMIRLLDALDGFHSSRLLHLDIAPDNIMLVGKGKGERVMLIDFNSCQPVGGSADASAVFSVKPGYTAPEVRGGRIQDIGPCSDLFSVTAVFYHAISGTILTPFQMMRPAPPDVSRCPCVADMPETVQSWVRQILRRGFCALPSRRYQTIQEMREDLSELLDRIDGVGITHWALWEAGWRSVERMIQDNPALEFIRDPETLYPSAVVRGGETLPMEAQVEALLSPDGDNALLLAGGGMGKTTALLRTAFGQPRRYAPAQPAIAYVSLYGWTGGEPHYILNRILETLRFKAETRTFEDARRVLTELLEQPLQRAVGAGPALLVMLDGLNEAAGDTGPLVREIAALGAMRGVRVLAATRTDEAALPFERLRLTELREADVQAALSAAGLLTPRSPEMQALLRTPLMLSIFIQSSKAERRQLSVSTREELMRVYFDALLEKAQEGRSENDSDRWQIDAALRFVLPALARELRRKQRALADAELLPPVEWCFRLFRSRLLRRAFPQWIGRSDAILGGAGNAEAWYGRIVHEILWKRLGLLLRDDQGRCQVSHQIIEDYLLALDRDNRRRITRRRRLRAALISVCLALTLAGGALACERWLRPKPPAAYDEARADDVMQRAAGAYVSLGAQYERLKTLSDSLTEDPASADAALLRYRQPGVGYRSAESSAYALELMLEPNPETGQTGEVMPWSGRAFDDASAALLFRLFDEREPEYALLAQVLAFVQTDPKARSLYGNTFPKLVSDLLELDADISAMLYQVVIQPHIVGRYADGSPMAENYMRAISDVTLQNGHWTDTTDPDVLRRNLNEYMAERTKTLNAIAATGAQSYWENAVGQTA